MDIIGNPPTVAIILERVGPMADFLQIRRSIPESHPLPPPPTPTSRRREGGTSSGCAWALS